MNDVKIVFIDWYKTLCSDLFIDKCPGHKKEVFQEFERKLFKENRELLVAWLRGYKSVHDVIATIAPESENLRQLYVLIKTSCQHMEFDDERFLPLIRKIRQKGIKVVIATDNMDVFEEYTAPVLNLKNEFDSIISSHHHHYLKADIVDGKLPFFDGFLEKEGLEYHNVVLIDDNEENTLACQKIGMKAVKINNSQDVVEYLEQFV